MRRSARRAELHRLYLLVLGLFMLVFAVRIGSIVAFAMHNPLVYEVAVAADGIHLPKAAALPMTYYPHTRLLTFITVTQDGTVEINNRRVQPDHWVQQLERVRSEQPKTSALLIVDRNCQMDVVQGLLYALREARIHQVHFARSNRDDARL